MTRRTRRRCDSDAHRRDAPHCRKLGALLAAALATVAAGAPAAADDAELFVATSGAVRPNVLLVIDDSASMAAEVLARDAYDPGAAYAGGCEAERVYYRIGTGAAPDCSTGRWLEAAALKCEAASAALGTTGHYVDKLVQYDPDTTAPDDAGERWEKIDAAERSRPVECRSDSGRHGDGVDADRLFPCDGSACDSRRWGGPDAQISWRDLWNDETYTLYAANYLNWAASPPRRRTRLEIVQEVATELIDSLDGVNVGLMGFTDGADGLQGGFVAHALEDVATARTAINAKIRALAPRTFTPLTETLYEAAAYYAGRNVAFGAASSVLEARAPGDTGVYRSPIVDACQKSHIVLLTDGEPTSGAAVDSDVRALVDHAGESFSSLVGAACDAEPYPAGFSAPGSQCLDDLARFMAAGDSSPLPGAQAVQTHTIGFTVDLPVLAETARRGGGTYHTVSDTASLAEALTSILVGVAGGDGVFAAPSVAVNAFNRTQHLSDLYVAVFRPAGRPQWHGNLKKYRLRARDGAVLDAAGLPAVDAATGSFSALAQSVWSPRVDGNDALAGGAASLLPAAAARKLYTYLGSNADLTHGSNAVTAANPALTDAVLAISGLGGEPTRDDVVRFMRGADVGDADGDGDTTDARSRIGDSLHAQPVTVVYGPGQRDGVVLVATNDGYLHAFDLETGVEQWAFVPREHLAEQTALYANEPSAEKHYGIDGDLRVLAVGDGDAELEPGERLFLYFGMGRGGDFYYALDVTDAARPKFLFRLDRTALPRLGQAWSPLTPARIDIDGAAYHADNAGKHVLVLGGGYEADQDLETLSTDSSGNAIYIVDAYSGRLLWSASNAGASQNFAALGRAMDYSIPGRIRVVDVDGDGDADRFYAGDMGGQVWRFDVRNGALASSLVAGGVIAQLGGAPSALPTPDAVRRFYYAPDIAFVNARAQSYVHVGLGSGHRGHPLSVTTHDRFYALRDYDLEPLSQAEFDALTPITDAALTKIASARTAVPPGSPGWRLDLDLATGWVGEKVLAEARTFNDEVVFSTFTPGRAAASCAPQGGTNRVYRMSVFDGAPVANLDGSVDAPGELTLSDVYVEREGGILPAAQAFFVDGDADGDGIPDGEEDADADGIPDSADPDADGSDTATRAAGPVICVGLACSPSGFTRGPVRTFWLQDGSD